MWFTALGYGFGLGHALFYVVQLPVGNKRYVLICFNHGVFMFEISRQERVWGGREASIGRPRAFDMLPEIPE